VSGVASTRSLADTKFSPVSLLRLAAQSFAKPGTAFRPVPMAVPMTIGQEFNAYANNLEEEILNLERNVKLLHEINMGGTAIGTGLNAVPGFAKLCAANLSKLTGENFVSASDLVEATPDTGAYVSYSSALKRLAIKLSKICNDLRLMASGPRCGLNEINLPPKAPGSSIMPGKVNPVIPEVTNQVCFKVIGNDTTVSFAAEAGQLELNVMEPIITASLFESLTWLKNAIETLTEECVLGITVNKERCYEMVKNSIGIVTALNPIIGCNVRMKFKITKIFYFFEKERLN
jgi:aspartate ammonia-lyase